MTSQERLEREAAHQQRVAHDRYLISVDAVQAGGPVVIHDMLHLTEQCNTDEIKHRSRFGDLAWALAHGYRPCEHCMTSGTVGDAGPQDESDVDSHRTGSSSLA